MTIHTARGKRAAAAKEQAAFAHASSHDDLVELIDDHILGPNDVEATSKWSPSRRGNSPHSDVRPPEHS